MVSGKSVEKGLAQKLMFFIKKMRSFKKFKSLICSKSCYDLCYLIFLCETHLWMKLTASLDENVLFKITFEIQNKHIKNFFQDSLVKLKKKKCCKLCVELSACPKTVQIVPHNL